jgi:hypothetical protein
VVIAKGIEEKEKLRGTAHVAEHVCLMPYYNIAKSNLKYARGYTCIDHVCLYFATIKKEGNWISDISESICKGKLINDQNVEEAKAQVIRECKNMENLTFQREKIVKFVTENRINNFAMGKVEDISRITCNDIDIWLNDIKKEDKLYKVNFCDKTEIIQEIKNITLRSKAHKDIKTSNYTSHEDMNLYLTKIEDKRYTINLYLKIKNILSIEELVAKTFVLCYIQYLCKKYFHINTFVKEKYFTYSERYAVITLVDINIDESKNIANKLRICLERKNTDNELSNYKKIFYEYMRKISSQNENNEDWINKLYNYVLYDIPIFNLKSIFELIDDIDKNILIYFHYIIHQPIRVVVKSSRNFENLHF